MNRIQNRRAATVANLCTLKDITPEIANAIREAWATEANRETARSAVNRLFHNGLPSDPFPVPMPVDDSPAFMVQYLGVHRRQRHDVYYCNAGDPYTPTILFCGDSLKVGCVGDLLEQNRIEEDSPNFRRY